MSYTIEQVDIDRDYLEYTHDQGGCNQTTRYGLSSYSELVALNQFPNAKLFCQTCMAYCDDTEFTKVS